MKKVLLLIIAINTLVFQTYAQEMKMDRIEAAKENYLAMCGVEALTG